MTTERPTATYEQIELVRTTHERFSMEPSRLKVLDATETVLVELAWRREAMRPRNPEDELPEERLLVLAYFDEIGEVACWQEPNGKFGPPMWRATIGEVTACIGSVTLQPVCWWPLPEVPR